jgi:thioredoxin 1
MKRMKSYIFLTAVLASLIFTNCNAGNKSADEKKSKKADVIVQLSDETFKKMVFNYEVNKEWKYLGSKPAIIDFYADWCAPCRQLSPIVEEIASEYEGRIVVYKVNTDKERVLTQNIGISSLPTLLFIPVNGKPQITIGVLPKESLLKTVKEILLTK